MGAGDVHGVLLSLEEEIVETLLDGSAVELGDICMLYPAVQGITEAEKPEDFEVSVHMKKRRIRILPRQSLGITIFSYGDTAATHLSYGSKCFSFWN